MVGIGLELFAGRRVTDGARELVFGDGRGDARPGAADGRDAAGLVLFATDRACLMR